MKKTLLISDTLHKYIIIIFFISFIFVVFFHSSSVGAEYKPEVFVQSGHSKWITSIDLSADGRLLVSGSSDNTIKLWDFVTHKEIKTLRGHDSSIGDVVLSPDSRFTLSGSLDNTLILWDNWSGRKVRVFRGHTDGVNSVDISPDGKLALSGSSDKTIRIWDIDSGKVIKILKGHTEKVNDVEFSPDGLFIISAADGGDKNKPDQRVKLWSVDSEHEIRTYAGDEKTSNEYKTDCENRKSAIAVAFSPNGKNVVSCCKYGTLSLWEVQTGRLIWSKKGRIHVWPSGSLAISRNGQYISVGSGPYV